MGCWLHYINLFLPTHCSSRLSYITCGPSRLLLPNKDRDKDTWLHQLLSHPSLGWLYVFSSFPPPRPRPRPPPQWLLLLMSKPFELDLRYLGQRKYGSGKMYWVTFGWPWPKVTAVTLINKNLLVCRIKWEPLNQSLQNFVAISLWAWSSPD